MSRDGLPNSLEHAVTLSPSLTLAESSTDADDEAPRSADTTVDKQRLGSYVLEYELGAGGMGEVFAARHLGTGERVALKTLSRASATSLYRFKREFRALADVSHPNLVRLFELGRTDDGRSFFTMELLDGVPFVEWVREGIEVGELPDLVRLELAFRQLIAGIRRLHASDCVHRDLKPSNVLVTIDGRVVILDFGLVSELGEPDRGITHDGQMLGTPAYMAPEQALGRKAGTPADYYAAGVMLYQCLTGALPYEGTGFQVLVDKQYTLDLDATLRDAPARLRELCTELLIRDPQRRLGGAALDAMLEADTIARGPGELFVGRQQELQQLHELYARVERDKVPVVAHLRGRSGEGKSALMRRFRAQLADTLCLVFHGRCRERETVPYKGIDAIVDAISAELRHRSRSELVELRPRFPGALVRVFPVLDELWADPQSQVLSPRELRGVSWGALRELVDGLARTQPLVVCIDDFQWADSDSVQLLHALLRPPRPPAVLLLLGVRNDLGESELLRELGETPLLRPQDATVIELGPLSETDAHALASMLRSDRAASDGAWAETIAVRSRGNPLFIMQMVDGDESPDGDADLDGLLMGRIAGLSPGSRAVLELVAVNGGPLTTELVLALAATAELADIGALVELGLLVVSGPRIETAHDRIRAVVCAGLDLASQAQLHTMLGRELLARCEGAPRGESLFRVVDQLSAGIDDLDDLDDATRLELAQLNASAGEAAFASGSAGLALDYFERARVLFEPWLREAGRGGAEHELGFIIEFGYARTLVDVTRRDAVYEQLLEWSLAPHEYGRVVVEWVLALYNSDRSRDAIALGLRAFRRLGVNLPRRPGLVWALFEFERGHRALTRLGADGIVQQRDAEDPTQRAMLDVLATVAGLALVTDEPLLGLGLAGRHARSFVELGFHDQALGMLWTIELILGSMGRASARELQTALLACEQTRSLSASNMAANRSSYLLDGARYRPIAAIVANLRGDHRFCCEIGQHRNADAILGLGPALCCETDIPIPEVLALIEELFGRSDHVGDVEFRRVAAATRQLLRVLVDGPSQVPLPGPEQVESPVSKYAFITRSIWAKVMLGDYEPAWAPTASIAADFERGLLGSWVTPIYACVSTIVLAERWQGAGRWERRKLRRTMQRHRKLVWRWSEDCSENFATMLALVDAEIALIDGHFDTAMQAYERARMLAETNAMRWPHGLASHRLSVQGRRRGHMLVADAAHKAAIATYRAWGATALVTRLEREA